MFYLCYKINMKNTTLFFVVVQLLAGAKTVRRNVDISKFTYQSINSYGFYRVNKDDITFRLWNRGTDKYIPIHKGDFNHILPNKPFKFIIHGYMTNADIHWYEVFKNEFLIKDNYNIIQVDWRDPASSWWYPTSAGYTKDVGIHVAQLIIDLNKTLHIPYKNFHLIGHSLGAHVCGFVGKAIKLKTGKEIGRITGLDPAGPLFNSADDVDKLDRYDAELVDVIHTDGGKLGHWAPIGHADFYPNDGYAPQPGCILFNNYIVGFVSCSHSRAYDLFGESINSNRFIANKCSSYEDYVNGLCYNNTNAVMGANIPTNTRGIFYLSTTGKKPFAIDNTV